jgi:hypothetical protein
MSSRHRYADENAATTEPTPAEQFVVIPLLGKPPANAIAHGSLSSFLTDSAARKQDRELAQELRTDAAALMDQAKELQSCIEGNKETENKFVDFARRVSMELDTLSTRPGALEESKRRRDAFEEEPITEPPGERRKSSTQGDDGELEANPPKDLEQYGEDSHELEEPEYSELDPELEEDNIGDLPANLRLEEPALPGPKPEPVVARSLNR